MAMISERIRELLGLYERHRAGLLEVRDRLADCQAIGGLVVAGEVELHAQLGQRLTGALDQLIGGQVEQSEAVLRASDWGVIAELRDALLQKHTDARAFLEAEHARWRDLEVKLLTVESALKRVDEALDAAQRQRAPVVRIERWCARVHSLLDQVRKDFQAHRTGPIAQSMAALSEALDRAPEGEGPSAADKVEETLKVRAQEAERRARELELLLIRSTGAGSFTYTVLLRSPQRGRLGVNLQGSSTLVVQDRARLLDGLLELAPGGVTRSMLPPGPPRAPRPFSEAGAELGRQLYQLLLPEEMRTVLGHHPGSVSITTNDLELPWELLGPGPERAGGGLEERLLCLRSPVARMPMSNQQPRENPPPAREAGRLRFALICADPRDDLPGARAEVRELQEFLAARWADYAEVTAVEADGASVAAALESGDFDVIHFAGHAFFDGKDGDQSGLLLQGEEMLLAQKIRRVTQGRPLVFLNACSSGATRNERLERVSEQLPAAGLAAAFVYGGAPACIGALWPIPDQGAAALARAFYDRVLAGFCIGEALMHARREVFSANADDPLWAAFVLYGNPGLQLMGEAAVLGSR